MDIPSYYNYDTEPRLDSTGGLTPVDLVSNFIQSCQLQKAPHYNNCLIKRANIPMRYL